MRAVLISIVQKKFNNLDSLTSAAVDFKYLNQFCAPLNRHAHARYILDIRNQLSRDSTVFLFRRVQNFTPRLSQLAAYKM